MIDPKILGEALASAGVERLPPPARAYLAGRLERQFATMGDAEDYEHNLGNLANITFGKAKTKAQLKKELKDEKKKLAAEKKKLADEKAKEAAAAQKAAQQQMMLQQQAQMQVNQAQQESQMAQQQAQMQQQFAQQQVDQANMQAQQAQQQAMMQPGMQQPMMQPAQQVAPSAQAAEEEEDSGPIEGADDPVDANPYATFPDIGAAARALVATSYRAAPRDWGRVSAAEIAGLDVYPITRIRPIGAAVPVPEGHIAIPVRSGGAWHVPETEADRWGAERIEGEWIAPTVDLGWWPGMGPSSEAEATFRGLMSDWEAFDRLKVGMPAPDGVLPHLRPDVVAWRKFRDEWKAGNIPSADIGGQLLAQVSVANRIRRELAAAKIIDPALKGDRQGIAVDEAAKLVKAAVPVDSFAKSIPGLSWLTDPTASPQAMQKKLVTTVAVVLAVALGGALLISRAAR